MGRYANPRIRVYNDALTLQGTITTVLHADYECALNEIGVGTFVIPLVDTPGRQLCVVNNVAVFTVEIDSTETAFGHIIITDVDDKTRESAGELIVSGYGHMQKLTYDRMNYTVISDGSGGKLTTARLAVLALSQYTWAISSTDYDATPRTTGSKLVPANETLFEALLQAGAQDQYNWVDKPNYPAAHTVNSVKDMDQLNSNPASSTTYDIDFRPDADDTNTDEIPIPEGGVKIIENRSQVPTRAYIYGGGSGQDRFTIEEADGLITPPSGFSFDFATSEVINDTMEALSNQPVISDNKNFPDIKPEDPDDATTVQASAVALCEAGLTYLIARQQTNDSFYEIDSTFVGKVVWPGVNYCRLTYSADSPYNASGSEVTTTVIDVDIATHILKVHYTFGADNVLIGSFLLGPAPRLVQTGMDETSERLQNVERRLDHLTAAASTSTPGGGGQTYANSDGQYLVLATNSVLTNERQFVAGAGLAATDGGANSTYTINVVAADTSLTINANDMQVRLAAASGLQVSSGLQVADSIAGAGLVIASKILAVGAGDGINVAADSIAVDVTDLVGTGLIEEATNNIALGTPSTLTVSTTNGVTTTSHTHAITSSNAVSTATAVLLATDSNGRVQVRGLGVNTAAAGDALYVNGNINLVGDRTIVAGNVAINLNDTFDIVSIDAISLRVRRYDDTRYSLNITPTSTEVTLTSYDNTGAATRPMVYTASSHTFTGGNINLVGNRSIIEGDNAIGINDTFNIIFADTASFRVRRYDATRYRLGITPTSTNVTLSAYDDTGAAALPMIYTASSHTFSGDVTVSNNLAVAGDLTITTNGDQTDRFLMANTNVSGGSVFYDFNQTDRDAGSTGAFELGFYRDANNITQLRMSKEIFEIIIRDGGTYYFPLEVRGNQVILAELPTSNPGIVGALYRSGSQVLVST